MKIKKSQLERLIKVAVLDILKELESRAQEAGIAEEGMGMSNPPSAPVGSPTMESVTEGKKVTPKKPAPKKPVPAPKKTPKTK